MNPIRDFIQYLDPTVQRDRTAPDAPQDQSSRGALPRVATFTGKTLVILDNGWKSFGKITGSMERTLRERFGVAEVRRQYISSSTPMPAAVLERVVAECDMVIVGMAN